MKLKTIQILLVFSIFVVAKEPKNLTLSKQQVQKYYESGNYQKDLDRVTKKALRYIQRQCVQSNSVIVFDIDETVFSYYQQAKSIEFGFIKDFFYQWIKTDKYKVIEPVKKIYDCAVSKGFKIIFLTGLNDMLSTDVIKNLHKYGFGIYEQSIFRSEYEKNMSAGCYKLQHRQKLLEQGYNIVATIGDQKSDFFGGYTGYKVKIPNPYYLTM